MAIPKIIHYIWLGKKEKPELFYRCLESWKKFCPDYEIKEWNEDNFDFSASPYAMQAYKNKKWGFVTDYIRVEILKKYGGFYLDTDVELVKSFYSLLDKQFVISFENGAYCETAVQGCVPNHPIPTLMRDFYLNHNIENKNGKLDLTPNTPIITYFLRKYFGLKMKNKTQELNFVLNKDITATVFSSDYFCPINYTTKKMKQTENTIAVHYFNATWFTKKIKTREKVLRCIYYIFTPWLFTWFTRIYTKNIGRKVKKVDSKIKHDFN